MNQRGQTIVLSLIFLVVLVGMAALVVDVGSWYRADRKLQANADAAALAGAQELPLDTAAAQAAALDYADTNDGGLKAEDVKFLTSSVPNDTIEVTTDRPAPGFFAQLFGRNVVDVRAKAVAKVGSPSEARWAAPIGVDERHPLLQCQPQPCFDQDTDLDLTKTGPGAFRLINIDQSRGGTSPATLGDWIRHGFDGYMPLNWYFSDPGAKFNSSHIKSALTDRLDTELLFPVYRNIRGQGANFEYFVVGWVVFHLDSFEAKGNSGKLYGHFESMIWEGILNESDSGEDFGMRSVALVE
jgi:putative Flp pilus-assembly TadE/G-like protein